MFARSLLRTRCSLVAKQLVSTQTFGKAIVYGASRRPASQLLQQRTFGSTYDINPESDALKVGDLIMTTRRSTAVINDPLLNKGTGFSEQERERLGLRGLVPSPIQTMQEQIDREMNKYNSTTSPIAKYSMLAALDNRNRTLYFRILVDNLETMNSIVYTPTVGLACQKYGDLFTRSRGMYFSAVDKGHMAGMTFNWPSDDVKVIVVTDGSRILGLGDLGVNGMGIPVGKLALYTAIGGIHPSQTLPVVLDVGTDNPELLNDPKYLGIRQPRLQGQAYLDVVDEFIGACRERWPNVLIQFEDFQNKWAEQLLKKYRNQVLCFNDDVQGTGAVALSGALAGLRAIGQLEANALTQQRIVIVGAGSAGLGVANSILYGLVNQGLTTDEACQRIFMLDDKGLIGAGRDCSNSQTKFRRSCSLQDGMDLLTVMQEVKPTMLIGLTGIPGLFTEEAVKEMAQHCERPIIFPLSNPTSSAECTAEQAFTWTDGRAIVASGSPFENVTLPSGQVCYPSQANNMWTFPAIGLAASAMECSVINRRMIYTIAESLAKLVPEDQLAKGKVFPHMKDIRSITQQIAVEMALVAHEDGVVSQHVTERIKTNKPLRDEVEHIVLDNVWEPHYGHTHYTPKNA